MTIPADPILDALALVGLVERLGSAGPLAEYLSLEGVECSHQWVSLYLADLVVSISATTGFDLGQFIDKRRAETLAADGGELSGGA